MRTFKKVDARMLANDVAGRFNQVELDMFRVLYQTARGWEHELTEHVIPGASTAEERAARTAELYELQNALMLYSELAKAQNTGDDTL